VQRGALVSPALSRRQWLVLAAAGLTACRSSGGSAGAAPRVVSLAPSTTEAMFAIGAGDLLVGRSKQCDYPPEALLLPVIGGFADPSIEAIVALRPTLAVGARGPAGPALEDTLRARGIATFFPETESIAQIRAMIGDLGHLVKHDDGGARANAAIDARLEAVARALGTRPKPRALLLFDVAPIFVAGPGGFPDELLARAGGVNVIDRGGAYPTIGLERLIALDPDVILDASMDASGPDPSAGVRGKRDAPGFRELRAVREGRVRVLEGSAALRPGPRVAEGVAAIARALYGDAFQLPASAAAP
jgi:cobalamin transport system substrate-binding protein